MKQDKGFIDVGDHHSIKLKSAVNLLAIDDYRAWVQEDNRRMTELRKHELLDLD